MKLTASAIWSDGFVGFDDTTHKMPDGYDVAFSVEPGGDAMVTKTGPLTADVTVGSDQSTDVIDATDGTNTATFDVAAPPLPVITGLRLDTTG